MVLFGRKTVTKEHHTAPPPQQVSGTPPNCATPGCPSFGTPTSRLIARSNRNGNNGRPYHKCSGCDKFYGFIEVDSINSAIAGVESTTKSAISEINSTASAVSGLNVAPELISDYHDCCFESFTNLIHALKHPVRDFGDQIPLWEVEDAFDRYKVWASNLGAKHRDRHYQISLDYRLSQSSFFRQQVINFLKTLDRHIQRAAELILQKREPAEERAVSAELEDGSNENISSDGASESSFEDSPWEISDSEKGDSPELETLGAGQLRSTATENFDASASEKVANLNHGSRKPTMEVPYTLAEIKFTISCLYRLPLRRPAPLDRLVNRAVIDTSIYQHFDVLYVKDKYPHANIELVTRLGKLISRRRQLLAARSSRDKNLTIEVRETVAIKHQSDLPVEEVNIDIREKPMIRETLPSQVSGSQKTNLTRATILQANEDSEEEPQETYVPPPSSDYATSVASSYTTSKKLELPKRPLGRDGRELVDFKCPYCFVACHVDSKYEWKKHIFRDLMPYVCSFEGCELYEHMFDRRDDWFQHEMQIHRVEWRCGQKPHPPFVDESAFVSHMIADHNMAVDSEQLSVFLSMFQRPRQDHTGICNLCHRQAMHLKAHLARHMEQIALFALPRENEVPEDGSGANLWGSAKASTKDEESIASESAKSLASEEIVPSERSSEDNSDIFSWDDRDAEIDKTYLVSSLDREQEWEFASANVQIDSDQDPILQNLRSGVVNRDEMARKKTTEERMSLKSTVPFPRNPHFVGREEVLVELRVKFRSTNVVALVGLGGVGKSHLAVEYGHRVQESLPGTWTFWINGTTSTGFHQSIEAIANILTLPTDNRPGEALERVVNWLRTTDEYWLIILDDPVGAAYHSPHIPAIVYGHSQSAHHHILITSRKMDPVVATATDDASNVIHIDSMLVEDAAKLVQSKLICSFSDALDLAHTLGYTPLAIIRAAEYILLKGPQYSVRKFMHSFRQQPSKYLSFHPGKYQIDDTSGTRSILESLSFSFENIQNQQPAAANLLSFMSCLCRRGIPELLLKHPSYDGYVDDIDILSTSFLLRRMADGESFEIPKIVQVSRIAWLEERNQLEKWKEMSVRVLFDIFPAGHVENWPTCAKLLPHVEKIAFRPPAAESSLKQWALLLTEAAAYALAMGKYSSAEDLIRQAIPAREKTLGSLHSDTLSSRRILASVLQAKAEFDSAEQISRAVLDGFEMTLGGEDPNTLASMNNLASILRDQGKYMESETLIQKALDTTEKVLGAMNPETLVTVRNLGLVHLHQSNYLRAAEVMSRVLERRKALFGEMHPDTLQSLVDVSTVARKQGNFQLAEAMSIQMIEQHETILGPDHPSTLSAMIEASITFRSRGKLPRAQSTGEAAASKMMRVLGDHHPETFRAINELAVTLRFRGRLVEAHTIWEKALGKMKRVLGDQHPMTLAVAASLEITLQDLSRKLDAYAVCAITLEEMSQDLGEDHQITLMAMMNLAVSLREICRLDSAKKLGSTVVEKMSSILGDGHFDTQRARAELAITLDSQSKFDEIVSIGELAT